MPEDQDCLPALSFCHTVLPYVHHYVTDAYKFLKLPFCLSLRETEERIFRSGEHGNWCGVKAVMVFREAGIIL